MTENALNFWECGGPKRIARAVVSATHMVGAGNLLATANLRTGAVHRWDLAQITNHSDLEPFSFGACKELRLALHGTRLAAVAWPDGQNACWLYVWDLQSGECTLRKQLTEPTNRSEVLLTEDCLLLTSFSGTCLARIALDSGEETKLSAGPNVEPREQYWRAARVGNTVVIGAGHVIRFWNLATGACEEQFVDHTMPYVTALQVVGSSLFVASGGDLTIWDIETRRCMQREPLNVGWPISCFNVVDDYLLMTSSSPREATAVTYFSARHFLREGLRTSQELAACTKCTPLPPPAAAPARENGCSIM